ncbi:hypothetical protein FPV67DRAFT_1153315 [Lyophyllum atratum]|nr:hypothetical protein FPV67DRAFT_1153315 [Lyophyllum atratum]
MDSQMENPGIGPELLASSIGSGVPRKLGPSPSEANVISQLLDTEYSDDKTASNDEELLSNTLECSHSSIEKADWMEMAPPEVQPAEAESEILAQKDDMAAPAETRDETIFNGGHTSTGDFRGDILQSLAMSAEDLANASATHISHPTDEKAQSSLGPEDNLRDPDEVTAALQVFSDENDALEEPLLPPNYPPIVYPPTAERPQSHPTQTDDAMLVDGGDDLNLNSADETMDDASSESSVGEDLRDELEGALHREFDFKGSYYYAATVPTAVNPCLIIEGLGYVGLPLSTRDAQAIIECSARAPFGHGEQTVMNTQVRDTWEIEPAKVKFDNPAWANFVGTYVVKTVCEALGVVPSTTVSPRCELHKLLLYEPGSHFLPHQDTEKTDGMFATVVIVLPTPYTGGQIHVSHSSSNNVIDLAPSSLLSTSVLAWYTDVKHEGKPLTSGYRLALSYNLINGVPGVPRPTLPDMSTAVNRLRHVLRKWRKGAYYEEEMDDNIVAYILEHKYSEADLQAGSKTLKGADAHRVANLRAVAEELGYMVCLADLEYYVSGSADDDDYGYSYGKRGRYGDYGDSSDNDEGTPCMGEVNETSLTLKSLVDLDGNLLIDEQELHLGEANLIPREAFEDQDPDHREHEKYMWDYPNAVQHYYYRTVLVLMHEQDAPDILFKAGGVDYAMQRLRKSISDTPTPDDKRMWDLLFKGFSGYDQATAAFMSDCALRWRDLDMWKNVIKKSGSLIMTTFGTDHIVRAWKMFTFQNVCSSFEEMLKNTRGLNDRISFIQTLPQHADPEEYEQIQAWAEEQSTRAFASLSLPTIEEIPAILAVARVKGAVFLVQVILPQLTKNQSTYPFTVAFVKALHEQKDSIPEQPASMLHSDTESQPAGRIHFDTLMKQLLNILVAQWESVVAEPNLGYHGPNLGYYGRYPPGPQRPQAVTQEPKIKRIIEIIDLCLLTGHVSSCSNLFLRLLKVQDSAADKFQRLYTPLVSRLRDFMRAKGVPLTSSPFSDFLQLIVASYLRDVLGAPGYSPNTYIRKIGCGCKDCASLDSFLTSTVPQQTFRLVQARRSHLEKRLDTARDLATYTTIRIGSPHGLQVTKVPDVVASQTWVGRVAQAKVFLRSIGNDDDLSQLMGNRYGDVIKALMGAQQFAVTVGDAAKISTVPVATSLQATAALTAAVHPVRVPLASSSINPAPASVAGPSMAGTKRKKAPGATAPTVNLGVVDLTGDDS